MTDLRTKIEQATDPWGSFEPYVQLVRSLLPRATSVSLFDATGTMRWTSETTTGQVSIQHAHETGALRAGTAHFQRILDEIEQIGPGGGLTRPTHGARGVEQRNAGRARQQRSYELNVRLKGAPGIGSLLILGAEVSHPPALLDRRAFRLKLQPSQTMVPRVLARVGESTEPNDTSRRNIELIHKPGAPRCAWRRSPKSGIGVATPAG